MSICNFNQTIKYGMNLHLHLSLDVPVLFYPIHCISKVTTVTHLGQYTCAMHLMEIRIPFIQYLDPLCHVPLICFINLSVIFCQPT